MLNRSVVLIRYQQPFVEWINAADPNPSHTITLSDANEDNVAYLVEVEDEEEFEGWLKANGKRLFELELGEWYTDEKLWPKERSLKMFKEWCRFDLHTVVLDTGGTPLLDDETGE